MGHAYLKPDKQAVPSTDISTCPPLIALKKNIKSFNLYHIQNNFISVM